MNSILRRALREAEKLPVEDQDAIASPLIAEVEDDHGSAARFANTTEDQWDRIVADVRQDVATRGVRPIEEVFSPDEPPR